MDISKELLTWIDGRANWQKDALRRLSQKAQLDQSDIEDICLLVKLESGLIVPPKHPVAIAIAISSTDLPDTTNNEIDSALTEILNINNAMRLKPDAKIDFAPNNLTIVYGNNGSGKSSFTKIIKRAAGTRGVEKIYPNVFSKEYETTPPACATFSIQKTSSGTPVVENIEWSEDEKNSSITSQMAVFDHRAASIYIGDETEVIYSPYHLDLLTGLVRACDDLKGLFEKDRRDMQREIQQLIFTIQDEGEARVYAQKLSEYTSKQDIEKASQWLEEQDQKRLVIVQQSLTQAVKEAKTLRARISRLQGVEKIISSSDKLLSTEMVLVYKKLNSSYSDAQKAVNFFSSEIFQSNLLSGVGEDPWKALWDAALHYSESVAYTGKEFPVTSDDAVCVLCQQPIKEEAKNHFENFKRFVEGDIQKQADAAKLKINSAQKQLSSLHLSLSEDQKTFLTEIYSDTSDLSEAISDYFVKAFSRKEKIESGFSCGNFDDLPEFPVSISSKLNEKINQWDAQAKQHESTLDPNKRLALETEEKELLTRLALSKSQAILIKIVSFHKSLSKVELCISGFNTSAITKQRNKLQKALFVEPFRQSLKQELTSLNVDYEVTLGFKGKRGASMQKMTFENTNFDKLEKILSEGEHRAIALACFLAEVQQLPVKVPVIIDDPVSSLDHIRRRLVAKRLVAAANDSQVIIFTHDLVFYVELMNEATVLQVPTRCHSLRECADGFGDIGGGEPWDIKDVKSRLTYLENDLLPSIRKLEKEKDLNYERQARAFGELLRETWERLVEEVIFAGVVTRFKPSIETNKLAGVIFDDSMWQEINRGMSLSSQWSHDKPLTTGEAPPSPAELAEEIKKIRTFQKEVVSNTQKIAKKRRQLTKAPPTA